MRRDAEPSAVRVLPSDGFDPIVPPPEPPSEPRRWIGPLAVVVGVLTVFLVATRPSNTAGDAAAMTTIPPSLSELNAEQINITTSPSAGSISGGWVEGEFDPEARISSLGRSTSSYVAVGWTQDGGQAWQSGNGIRWTPVASLELPEAAKTSLDHATFWQGNMVVLGSVDDQVGLWVTNGMTRWEFQGPVESMGTNSVSNLAAGSELLAISSATVQGWMSTDGLEWRPLGRLPVLEAADRIETLAATEEWYFAGGAACQSGRCSPVIYRSPDGLAWEPAGGELPDRLSADVGVVMDIEVTATGLLAVGELDQRVAIWWSADGAHWEQTALDEETFSQQHVVVEVIATRTGENPLATLTLNGTEHQVTVGSEIVSDNGLIVVDGITDGYIMVGDGGSSRGIMVNTPTELRARSTAWQIVAEGPRLVIAGEVLGEFNSSAAVWTSADAGATWDRTLAPASGAFSVATAGQNLVVLGDSTQSDSVGVWRTTWDKTAIGDAATEALAGYLDALSQYDAQALTALLPANHPNTPHFEVPSLGVERHQWWDTETGNLQSDKVAATVAYLEATNVAIERGDCTPTVSLGNTDRVSVTCDFQVDSDLLTTLGFNEATGRIQAAVADGRLASVAISTSPSEAMWTTLALGIAGETEQERETLFAQDDSGTEVLAPTFDTTTATIHLSLAGEFVAGLLRPGETRVIETALGTMEWSWIDPLDLPVFQLETVSWSDLGFIATGRGQPDQYTEQLSIWMSADGVEWVETAAPDNVDSIWGLRPFGDGVAGQAWAHDTPSILYFDGTTWTTVELPNNEAGDQDLLYVGVGNDRILAIAGAWQDENGPTIDDAWIIGEDLELAEIPLPPVDDWTETNVGLAADDSGFILSLTSYFDSRNLRVWHTTDGFDWTLIAESAAIEGASYLWNLQQHRLQYFVVGEGMELRCTPDGAGEICESTVGLWSSPDGTAWDRVLTRAGSPVSTYEIGSGDLGLVAFGPPSYGAQIPRAVYLSADGREWHQAGGLSLLYPDVEWWWVNTPAVSSDTIVAAGSAYQEGDNIDRPFMLVGRLVSGAS